MPTSTENNIEAHPTKSFFVSMLTRDIDLKDAILDLLDNCVDGIIRHGNTSGKTPYKNYHAKITATPNEFVIEDNCEGIERDIAKKVAFRMGRPSDISRDNKKTVGVYGIGMKRAIFKLGKNATIESEHNKNRFRVIIDEKWIKDDKDWTLSMQNQPSTGTSGTKIRVTGLHEQIARSFDKDNHTFLNELTEAIAELFAIIISKGFRVFLNGTLIEPTSIKLLTTNASDDSSAINPYIFKGEFPGVKVEIVVGFYRSPLSSDEMEDDDETPDKADLSLAGWSIICNDRLVLRGDKSAVTGWGTANVPRFHYQYSSIAGTLTMSSDNTELLPLNTTKRGLETSSDLYFRLLDYMREGVKVFTDYTNKWKNNHREAQSQFKATKSIEAIAVSNNIPKESFTKVSDKRLSIPNAKAVYFSPKLPVPQKSGTNTKRISFDKPTSQIRLLATKLLDSPDALPRQVGEACFDELYNKYKR